MRRRELRERVDCKRHTDEEDYRARSLRALTLRGFINYDFADLYPDFLEEVGAGVRSGAIRYREDIVEGLANAPEAFLGMLEGRNFGKLLVKVH